MKKDIRKILLAFAFLTSICLGAAGQTTPKEITDKFFALYATDPLKAVEYGFSTNKWSARKPDAITDLENKLKNLVSLLDDYYGYEELTEKSAWECTKMVTFLLRYDREPIRFSFLFYKPKDTWRLYSLSYDEDIDEDLKEASKAYRLRENISY